MTAEEIIRDIIDNGMFSAGADEVRNLSARTEVAAPLYVEIGILNRPRSGAVHFIQEAQEIPLPVHGTLKVFMRHEPQEQR